MTPVQIKRVLVGVELEGSSESAIAAAAALAGIFHATLTAVHAHSLEVPAYFTEAQLEALEAEREQIRARLMAEVQALAARQTSLPVAPIAEEGTPADVILRLAPAFDLVILGTRRLHGARRWWLGSVAEDVVHRASVPVLVVPAGVPAAGVLSAGASIVTAGPPGTRAEAWVAALANAVKGSVERAGELAGCTPETLRHADLVVVALPPESRIDDDFSGIVQVLKQCSHPVLFVPAAEAALPRS